MKRSIRVLLVIGLMALSSLAFSKNEKPLKLLDKPTYFNGELDYYRVMKGGVLDSEWAVIYTNISPDVLRIYYLMKGGLYKANWPKDYTKSDITDYFDIDLKTGSMIYHKMDLLPVFKKNGLKGYYYVEYYFEGDTLILKMKDWDGTSSRERLQRMENINKNIPLLDYDALMFVINRIFDVDDNGLLQTVSPTILKDPVRGKFKKAGSMEVTTQMGKFKVNKYVNMLAGDPFLYNLLKNYVKGYVFYIEQGNQRRLIKFDDKIKRMQGFLTEVTTWGEFKKKHIDKK